MKRTNANGEYTINNIPAGRHTVRVSADGYKSYKGQVTIQAGISVTRDVALERQPSEGYRLPFPGGKKYKCTQGNNGVPQTGHWYRSGNYLVSSLDSLAALEQDTEPPEGSVQFRLTGQPTHQLWLDAFDYVSDDLQMRLASTYTALQTAVWQPFSRSVEWTLPEVWAQYRDEDGNVSDVYSDTIDAIAYESIQAAFVISPTVCADSVVPLDNSTTPFCEQCGWNWDFGDGTNSIEAYPLFPDIAYADPDTYTVTLTVAGAMNISSVSKQVTVLPSPSPDFTMIRSGTTITVEASVADAASWEWDFGDGITATGRTTMHTYTEPLTETYPVQLTVRGTNGCVGVGHQYVTQSEIYLPIILKSY